jgi:hypothetical protein
MSKARARERKKKRLAQMHAAKSAPAVAHEPEMHATGADHTPTAVAEQKHKPGKFDPRLNTGGKSGGGKNIPNLAASSRGAARSG